MKQYLDLCNRIVNEGKWVANERTAKRCLTVINADLTYNVENGEFPLISEGFHQYPLLSPNDNLNFYYNKYN